MKNKCGITPEKISALRDNEIFVFGSNLAGAHGGGAAHLARKWGAMWGRGEGLQGQTYALPTMSTHLTALHRTSLPPYVQNLYKTVQAYPHLHFLITKVGCGIAGYQPADIAPLFTSFITLTNCSLPQEFIDIIERGEHEEKHGNEGI